MTTRTVLVCDICAKQGPARKLVGQAIEAATGQGFRLYEHHLDAWIDLCPECWENQQ